MATCTINFDPRDDFPHENQKEFMDECLTAKEAETAEWDFRSSEIVLTFKAERSFLFILSDLDEQGYSVDEFVSIGWKRDGE